MLLEKLQIEPAGSWAERRTLLEALRGEFIGLDTEYPLVDGGAVRRTYLDSAASNLCLKVTDRIVRQALAHYANTHSQLHFSARIMTELYHWAHEVVRGFVGAPEDYTAIFVGNGVTGALNRIARVLKERRPERDVVITTLMEHHANDLPHRKHVGHVVHIPVEKDPDGEAGKVNMEALRNAIREHAGRLNYVAITAASNVTGITNPVHEIARLAHKVDALVVVDAAQSAAHTPIAVTTDAPEEALDVVCLSGHKIYTPGSPGVLIARKDLFEGIEPQEVGGGIVSFVDAKRYTVMQELPDREETGTPNIPGALGLAATLYLMSRIGMDVIEEDERELTQYALERIEAIKGVHIYGSHRLEVADRIGVITFNVAGLPHGLVAAALNDYFGIAVRNDCFCAQPFVRQLLGIADEHGVAPESCGGDYLPGTRPGMVRVSFGLYNTRDDVDRVVEALTHIAENTAFYRKHYRPVPGHESAFRHRDFQFSVDDAFSIAREVDAWLEQA